MNLQKKALYPAPHMRKVRHVERNFLCVYDAMVKELPIAQIKSGYRFLLF